MGDLFLWQKNLLHSIGTRPVVILHGNIRDLYVFRDPSLLYESSLDEVLVRLLSPRYGPLLRYDPYAKAAELSLGAADALAIKALPDYGAPGFNVTTDPTIARVLGDLETAGQRHLWYFKYMHNMLPYRSSYSQEEGLRLIAFQRIAENIAAGNRLILSYLSDAQIPVELSQNAHRVALVKVPLPDFAERSAFWTSRLAGNERLASDLAKLTDGMALSSLATLAQLARETREIPDLSLSDWEREIAHFKFGDRQNYYDQIRLEDLEKAEEFFTVQEGIQGQSHAVEKAVQMLWKARTNVGALLRTEASGAPPRGVLFCCGPSGTGKTMLGKKLAKFVFGTETAFYRIDMSEFQQDHTVSKLIGAPPGYVGFEMGGTLTNAVLERPFSVLLFDEIEKAHPRIFDLFLQVLSDGRLTDSRGQTVFFSEAIILFTSNLGTRKDEIAQLQAARASGDPERVRKHFVQCVQDFFRLEISRPELLNRIGNNIVPFNFLDDEKIAVSALRLYLCKMQSRFDEEHGPRKLRLEIDFDQVAGLLAARHGKEISEFGGKAVLNTLDTVILPELARCLLELEMRPRPAGATIRISAPPGLGRVEVAVGGPSRGGKAG